MKLKIYFLILFTLFLNNTSVAQISLKEVDKHLVSLITFNEASDYIGIDYKGSESLLIIWFLQQYDGGEEGQVEFCREQRNIFVPYIQRLLDMEGLVYTLSDKPMLIRPESNGTIVWTVVFTIPGEHRNIIDRIRIVGHNIDEAISYRYADPDKGNSARKHDARLDIVKEIREKLKISRYQELVVRDKLHKK